MHKVKLSCVYHPYVSKTMDCYATTLLIRNSLAISDCYSIQTSSPLIFYIFFNHFAKLYDGFKILQANSRGAPRV
jgi:hypothetical protein